MDPHDHSSLRYVIYAGAPMYRADQQHALRKLGPVLVQYFGLGEVTGNITVLPPHLHSADDDPAFPIGSCGMPRTGMDIAILDAGRRRASAPARPARSASAARRCSPATGTTRRRRPRPSPMAGSTPATSAISTTRGFLYITGRASDMFISGGSNVYPREIEEALLLHPAVAEACIVGLPHPKWGESGVAVLVLHPGAAASPS